MNYTNIKYDFQQSLVRIDNIFFETNYYEQRDTIARETELTFQNGYYVDATAIFIDLRDSKKLNHEQHRRTLARVYKAFISEATAIINSYIGCKHIYIEGDCVWGMIETPYAYQINEVYLEVACKLAGLISVLNVKIKKQYKSFPQINAGIGISFGNALMVRSGYKGASVNETIWIGEVVGKAATLSGKGGRGGINRIVIDPSFYNKLNVENRKEFVSFYGEGDYNYHSNYVATVMHQWSENNK
jgi:class 3 adenylate cyclase